MCGRYSLIQRLEALERIFRAKARSKIALPRYNIAPTQPVAVICNDEPTVIREIEWGFTLFPTDETPPRKLINAKAETLQERAAYRDAFRARRCLVLADGFFEWQTNGARRYPKYFRLRTREPFAFAGLYDEDAGARHAVIVTTQANDLVASAHSRMPVILSDPGKWLDDSLTPQQRQHLLRPYESAPMEGLTVNPIVNSPAYDGADCIEPYDPPQLPLF